MTQLHCTTKSWKSSK